MTFDQQLFELADRYRAQGYAVVVHPGPDDLPDFARAFSVQLCCRRQDEGVLVAAFPNLIAMRSDSRTAQYAETVSAQSGWRLDLAILGTEPAPPDPLVGDARDLTADQIVTSVGTAEKAADLGFPREALVSVWGLMEAAARRLLRTRGESVQWNKPWREMASELVSDSVLSYPEFDRLKALYQERNRIAHGFVDAEADASSVHFIADLVRRLSSESTMDLVVNH